MKLSEIDRVSHIALLDTSIGSDNVGDEIIMDYCRHQLAAIFNKHSQWGGVKCIDRIPTHLSVCKDAHTLVNKADFRFVCGTNILKTSILRHKIWKIGLAEALSMKEVCLMGVGWGNYNKFGTDLYTKWVYRSLFSKTLWHSVRDSYTEQQLKKIGITNVINTACPTMWNLTPEFCETIPTRKSDKVVAALTCYKPDVERDKQMMNTLHDNYNEIFVWLQQADDLAYLKMLNLNFDVNVLHPQLSEYDAFLENNNVDFVGSRLHGGIRALNKGRRTLVIGIDNRATEINKDTHLPFLRRDDMDKLKEWINGDTPINIILPQDNINRWKEQFGV